MDSAGRRYLQIFVVVAVLVVLAWLAMPTFICHGVRGEQAFAMSNMRLLGGALATYVGQNDGMFPAEGVVEGDTWANAAKPENKKVWYNALPRILGYKEVGGYVNTPAEFYTKKSFLFLPGASYPKEATRLTAPLFAIAINAELFRESHERKEKMPPKVSEISEPARTVAFLEQGLPQEKKAMPVQPAFHGGCKGSAKSFVARYGGKGVLTFVDGHCDIIEGKDVLTETGKFHFPQKDVIWSKTPDEDPNK